MGGVVSTRQSGDGHGQSQFKANLSSTEQHSLRKIVGMHKCACAHVYIQETDIYIYIYIFVYI